MDILTAEQKEALEQLENNGVFSLAVKSAFNHIVITDEEGTILYANQATQRITGFAQNEIIGKNPKVWGGLMGKKFYEKLWNTIKVEKRPFISKIINRQNTGEKYWAQIIITPMLDEDAKLIGFIGTEEQISDPEQT